jgi:hypothetical protein
MSENEKIISMNNHLKARLHPEVIRTSLLKDVHHGFCTPLSIEIAKKIPNAMFCPLGIVAQQTLSADGSRREKLRLTHDQSYSTNDDYHSVNDLTDTQQLPELIYGFTLQRIIYQALSLRWHHPDSLILCVKYDFSSAYRRIHYSAHSSARCISVHDGTAFLLHRLSFGGTSCPFSWCPVGEIITDLANDLLDNHSWDPSPHLHRDPIPILPPVRIPSDTPISPTLPTLLLPPPKPNGFSDVYVDDTTTLFIDTPSNLRRAPQAIPEATATLARPSSDNEPVPREPLISAEKCLAEGAPSEVKTILGWHLNFRTLHISLPQEKVATWCADIQSTISSKRTTRKELERLIGRLNHAAQIIPLSRFFLGPLRHLLSLGKHDNSTLKVNGKLTSLLELWTSLLHGAGRGISFNLLSVREPTNVILTDACGHGIGGISVTSGVAWRLAIPANTDTSNNILEFLASVMGILIECRLSYVPPLGQVLSLTDNSSAAAWLHRCNANPTTSHTLYRIATKLAHTAVDSNFSVHPQHVKGEHNNIADCLSRLPTHDDQYLTRFISSSFPAQTPPNFRLIQVPADLVSWVFSVLPTRRGSSTGTPKTQQRNEIAHGAGGPSSSPPSDTPTTTSSTERIVRFAPRSQLPSSRLCDKGTSRPTTYREDNSAMIKRTFALELSERPLASWLRNSDALRGPARFTDTTTKTRSIQRSFSSSELGTSWIRPRGVKRRFALPTSPSSIVTPPDSPTQSSSLKPTS